MFGADGNPASMVLKDFNDDTFPDLFICMCSGPDQVWLNDGSGNFSNSEQALGSDSGNDYPDCKDIDGDGDNDVIVANTEEGMKIWLNQNNSGVFVESGEYFGNVNSRCKLFDADLDSDFDLIVTHPDIGNLLLMNDGNGNFTSLGETFGNSPVIRIEYADLDGDNDFDVVFGQGENTGGNPIFFNESTIVGTNEIIHTGISLYNFPNPFNPSTIISFQTTNLHESSAIEIYNLKGQKIRTIPIFSSTHQPINSVIWNGTDQSDLLVSSGIYFYKLNIPKSPVKKMILVK